MKQGTWIQRSDGTIELRGGKTSGGVPATPKEAAKFFAVVALIIALIWGFVQLYKIAYSPNSIDVDLISISTEHIPSKSPYSDGTRYIHLDFEVESRKHKVDQINLYLNVSDLSGKNLGCLNVSLGDSYNRLELAKGSKQTIKLSFNDDKIYSGNEDIFEILYSMDFSDLTFTCEIWRIDFSNGYTYTN